ncbi:MAG: heme o synthase [Leptospiraceae bacterium]|nr:heme o synthase [Leptospiraceae bacterium]
MMMTVQAQSRSITPSEVYKLLKPGLAGSIIITVLPGMLLGVQLPSPVLVAFTCVGTMLMAMGSFVYNQILEIDRDARMQRTRDRPLPTGKITPTTAYVIAASLLCTGLFVLASGVNLLAALIALFSFLFYVFIYTAILKTGTHLNTVMGGVAGAIGPMIGEAAVTGSVSHYGWFLFLLLFIWQPPHFWCLAIRYREDYAAAGYRMLPLVKGLRTTYNEMLIFQALLVATMLLAYFPLRMVGLIFVIPAAGWGLFVWIMMLRLRRQHIDNPEPPTLPVFFLTIAHMLIWHLAMAMELYFTRFAG